ncbi:MAG: PspA/IM30 family protein [Bernardetiaceae bacterium]
MWNYLKRLLKIGEAHVHQKLDQMEDPIRITEQNVAALKKDLHEGARGLSEIRAAAIRAKRENERARRIADNYEQKAILLLKKAYQGEIPQEQADRLAKQALMQKESMYQQLQNGEQEIQKYESLVQEMDMRVQQIRSQVIKYENELRTLKARSKISKATQNLHESLSRFDASGMHTMLDKIKDQVSEQEAIADSYEEVSRQMRDPDYEVNQALGNSSPPEIERAIEDIKKRILIETAEEPKRFRLRDQKEPPQNEHE